MYTLLGTRRVPEMGNGLLEMRESMGFEEAHAFEMDLQKKFLAIEKEKAARDAAKAAARAAAQEAEPELADMEPPVDHELEALSDDARRAMDSCMKELDSEEKFRHYLREVAEAEILKTVEKYVKNRRNRLWLMEIKIDQLALKFPEAADYLRTHPDKTPMKYLEDRDDKELIVWHSDVPADYYPDGVTTYALELQRRLDEFRNGKYGYPIEMLSLGRPVSEGIFPNAKYGEDWTPFPPVHPREGERNEHEGKPYDHLWRPIDKDGNILDHRPFNWLMPDENVAEGSDYEDSVANEPVSEALDVEDATADAHITDEVPDSEDSVADSLTAETHRVGDSAADPLAVDDVVAKHPAAGHLIAQAHSIGDSIAGPSGVNDSVAKVSAADPSVSGSSSKDKLSDVPLDPELNHSSECRRSFNYTRGRSEYHRHRRLGLEMQKMDWNIKLASVPSNSYVFEREVCWPWKKEQRTSTGLFVLLCPKCSRAALTQPFSPGHHEARAHLEKCGIPLQELEDDEAIFKSFSVIVVPTNNRVKVTHDWAQQHNAVLPHHVQNSQTVTAPPPRPRKRRRETEDEAEDEEDDGINPPSPKKRPRRELRSEPSNNLTRPIFEAYMVLLRHDDIGPPTDREPTRNWAREHNARAAILAQKPPTQTTSSNTRVELPPARLQKRRKVEEEDTFVSSEALKAIWNYRHPPKR
ncbi:hypothetical protein B0T17DRAFT_596039 [Bombardia bombarda]|uniref:Uncharacterized protein n=1 Tax=Bombardia bombarda TaxID=252184 RepID=A0AA40CFQ0_9PEZI|nr:hypothetical protein B0T17DRAFT_596039 [Bombardia bombarda]